MVYFHGEKNAGLFLTGVGAAILVAVAVMFRTRPDLRAFAVTLGVVALAEIALGVGLYLRTGPQVSSLLSQLASDAARFSTEEGARMVRVQRNFVAVEYVELAVIPVTAILAVVLKGRTAVAGVSLGLLIKRRRPFVLRHRRGASRRGLGDPTAPMICRSNLERPRNTHYTRLFRKDECGRAAEGLALIRSHPDG